MEIQTLTPERGLSRWAPILPPVSPPTGRYVLVHVLLLLVVLYLENINGWLTLGANGSGAAHFPHFTGKPMPDIRHKSLSLQKTCPVTFDISCFLWRVTPPLEFAETCLTTDCHVRDNVILNDCEQSQIFVSSFSAL